MALVQVLVVFLAWVGVALVLAWFARHVGYDQSSPSKDREDAIGLMEMLGGKEAADAEELEEDELEAVQEYSALAEDVDDLSVEEDDEDAILDTLQDYTEAESELLLQWKRRLKHMDTADVEDRMSLIEDLNEILEELLSIARDSGGIEKSQKWIERLIKANKDDLEDLDEHEEHLREELQEENELIQEDLEEARSMDIESEEDEEMVQALINDLNEVLQSNRDSIQEIIKAREKIQQAEQRERVIKEKIDDLEEHTDDFLDTLDDVEEDFEKVINAYEDDPRSEDVDNASETVITDLTDSNAVRLQAKWQENIKKHNDLFEAFGEYEDLIDEILRLVDVEIEQHHEA